MERQVLFGSRIRAIREAKNLSREVAAERAGINPNYLGELERGEKWPKIEMMERVAAVGIPVKVNIDSGGEAERHSGAKANSSRSEATLAR